VIDGEIHTWNCASFERTHAEVLRTLGHFAASGKNCCVIAPSGACTVSPAWDMPSNWDEKSQLKLYELERNLYYDPDAYWREFHAAALSKVA
jgi:hypothetical protein